MTYDTLHISHLSSGTRVALVFHRAGVTSVLGERFACQRHHGAFACLNGWSIRLERVPHTETSFGIPGGSTEGAPLAKRSGGTGVWTNTKQLHELRATGILSDEECAAQIQNHLTEVLKPASSKRPAAAVASATPPASQGSSSQQKAAKPSTQREMARERAAANVLGGNIVNAF